MKPIDKAGILLLLGLFSSLTFKSGEYYQQYRLKPVAVEYSCGYYNMKTGDFVWGKPPLTTEQLSLDNIDNGPKGGLPAPIKGGHNG